MKTKMVKSEHHRDKMVPLVLVLSSLAAQEGCDGFEYDMMEEAADYIVTLENYITTLELKLGLINDQNIENQKF